MSVMGPRLGHNIQILCCVRSPIYVAQFKHHDTHIQGTKRAPIVVLQWSCLHFWSWGRAVQRKPDGGCGHHIHVVFIKLKQLVHAK